MLWVISLIMTHNELFLVDPYKDKLNSPHMYIRSSVGSLNLKAGTAVETETTLLPEVNRLPVKVICDYLVLRSLIG